MSDWLQISDGSPVAAVLAAPDRNAVLIRYADGSTETIPLHATTKGLQNETV